MSTNFSSHNILLHVKDFYANSPLLIELRWTPNVLCAMIRAGTMYGQHLSNEGGWHTTKSAILDAITYRNSKSFAMPVDMEQAQRLVSAVSLRLSG